MNDGAITQYPYRMGDTISIAKTHWQWNQLAMEQDKDINGRCGDMVLPGQQYIV